MTRSKTGRGGPPIDGACLGLDGVCGGGVSWEVVEEGEAGELVLGDVGAELAATLGDDVEARAGSLEVIPVLGGATGVPSMADLMHLLNRSIQANCSSWDLQAT